MSLLFWRKKRPAAKDPIVAFDAEIERVEARAATVRKAAAVLLAVQGELAMQLEASRRKADEVQRRLASARREGDGASVEVLERDLARTENERTGLKADLERVRGDAEQLKAAGLTLADEVAALRREQSLARTRLAAGEAITTAFHSRSEAFEAALNLDDARSEIERAHALAELYREDRRQQ